MAKTEDYIQRTLVVLKPDTVQRGIIGRSCRAGCGRNSSAL